jgi:hypothetical protein
VIVRHVPAAGVLAKEVGEFEKLAGHWDAVVQTRSELGKRMISHDLGRGGASGLLLCLDVMFFVAIFTDSRGRGALPSNQK